MLTIGSKLWVLVLVITLKRPHTMAAIGTLIMVIVKKHKTDTEGNCTINREPQYEVGTNIGHRNIGDIREYDNRSSSLIATSLVGLLFQLRRVRAYLMHPCQIRTMRAGFTDILQHLPAIIGADTSSHPLSSTCLVNSATCATTRQSLDTKTGSPKHT